MSALVFSFLQSELLHDPITNSGEHSEIQCHEKVCGAFGFLHECVVKCDLIFRSPNIRTNIGLESDFCVFLYRFFENVFLK